MSATPLRVPFNMLRLGEERADIDQAIARVLDSGWFVLGPEVAAFESEFAAAMGARHAAGVNTGTDAIALALMALGIGHGDEVITSPLSAAYSALAIDMAGATPVFGTSCATQKTLVDNLLFGFGSNLGSHHHWSRQHGIDANLWIASRELYSQTSSHRFDHSLAEMNQ